MPRIPVQDGQRVANRPVGASYSNTDFRTGATELSAGLQELGQGVARLQQAEDRARQKALAVDITESETAWKRDETSTLYGMTGEDGRQSPGFLSLQGKDAAAATEAALAGLEKKRDEYAAKLTDPRARQAFTLRINGLLEGTRRQVEGHVAGEIRKAETAAVQSRVEQAILSIANNPLDEEAIAKERIAIEAPVRALMSQEAADAALAEFEKKATSVRVESLLSKGRSDWRSARALLQQNRDSFLPKERAAYEKVIGELELAERADTAAMELVDKARDEKTGRVNEGRVYADLHRVPSDIRDEVRQRAEHLVVLEGKAWKEQAEGRYDSAFSAYLKSGSLSAVDPRDKAWLIDNDPESWDKLRQKAQRDARYWRDRAEGKKPTPPTPAQKEAYVALRADIAANPEKYASEGYTAATFTKDWGDKLHPSDYEQGGVAFAATKKDKKESASEFGRFVRDRANGVPAFNKDKVSRDLYLSRMGDLRRRYLESSGGKEPSYEEMDDMHAAAVHEVITHKGIIYDTKKPAYKVPLKDLDAMSGGEQGATGGTPTSSVDLNQPPPAASPSSPGPGWVRGSHKGRSGYFNPTTKAFRPDP